MISRRLFQRNFKILSQARIHIQQRHHHILFAQATTAATNSSSINTTATDDITKQTFTTTTSSSSTPSNQKQKYKNKAYIGIGSNLGNRIQHMNHALSLLTSSSSSSNTTTNYPISITKTSYLHETKPMYVLDQPSFLNAVLELSTDLSPMELLNTLKHIEETCGREMKNGVRYGPRVIDLDILLYYQIPEEKEEEEEAVMINLPNLTIPHPLMTEREFVLKPLCDLHPNLRHPQTNTSMFQTLQQLYESTEKEAVRVLPLGNNRLLAFHQTLVMGILNVTPDSFSDGGKFYDEDEEGKFCKKAVEEAMYMVQEGGVDVIDIGGESTRPGSTEVLVEEEMRRVLPVIKGIRQVSDIPISIDTRHSTVAHAAIQAGADIINDISGGTFDPQMLPLTSTLNVPIILMHSRGTPQTMTQSKYTTYKDVVQDVAKELWDRVEDAEEQGIHRWNIMLDPGIGFAKDSHGNLSLLKHGGGKLRELLCDASMLWGPSRKRFIGRITGEENAEERDFGTIGACIAAICGGDGGGTKSEWRQGGGCNMLRVHNVKAVKQAVMVMDAIRKAD